MPSSSSTDFTRDILTWQICRDLPSVQDRRHHKELHLWQIREDSHGDGQHRPAQDQAGAIPPVVGAEAEEEEPASLLLHGHPQGTLELVLGAPGIK